MTGHTPAGAEKPGRKLRELGFPLGLACLGSLLLFWADSPQQIGSALGVANAWFWFVPAILAIICSGLAFALRPALANPKIRRTLGALGGIAAIAGLAACLLIAFNPASLGLVGQSAAYVLAASLFGLGLGTLGMVWLLALSGWDAPKVRASLIAAALLTLPIRLLLLALPQPGETIAAILLLVLSTLTLCVQIPQTLSPSPGKPLIAPGQGLALFGQIWVPLGGLACCLSIDAGYWIVMLGGAGESSFPASGGQWGTIAGMLAAALLAWRFLAAAGTADRMGALALFLPLLCVVAILLAWFLSVWNQGYFALASLQPEAASFVACFPLGFATLAISLLLVYFLAAETPSGLSPALLPGLLLVFCAGALLVFCLLYLVLGTSAGILVDLLLKVLYVAAAIVAIFWRGQQRQAAANHAAQPELQEFCQRNALSQREAQIFAYLIQGHSAPYISKAEFISLSTVKTHIRHIYAKADVSSKDELLDSFYNCSEQNLHP